MMVFYYLLGICILGAIILIGAMSTAPLMDEEGNLLDKDGNIIDNKGRIIKTVDEVKKEFAEEFNKTYKKIKK